MNPGLWIPIVAILATFAVPVVAIIMDFQRRKLRYEERRAMIERGMPVPEWSDYDVNGRSPGDRRECALRNGIIMVCLGVGLAIGAYLLLNVVTETFVPRRLGGSMAVAAPIVGFIGLGYLAFHAVSRRRGPPEA